jgi:hypothetical protein
MGKTVKLAREPGRASYRYILSFSLTRPFTHLIDAMTSNTDEQGNSFALLSSISNRGGVVVLVGVIGGSGLYHLDNLTFMCVS